MTDTNITIVSQFDVIDAGKLSVAELGQRIQNQVLMLESRLKEATRYALEIGTLLTEAKSQVQHGEWEAWLSDHCNLAPRTARAYMKLAKEFPAMAAAKRQRVANLPVREALKAIATDPTPPVKYQSTRRLNTIAERERVKAVFVSARNQLTKAARVLEGGFPVKGNEVQSLRKHLEAVLEQLNELQNEPSQIESEGAAK